MIRRALLPSLAALALAACAVPPPKPMPLLSRGGTSSIILLASFGVVMALGARRTIHR